MIRRPMLTQPPNAPTGKRPVRVLVVDDSEDVAEMTMELLRIHGYEVCSAGDGPGALAAVARERPDVVLLDLTLPGMDGLQVAEALHASGGEGPLVVAVSGLYRDEDSERLRRAGCEHHLGKPMDFDRVLALIAESTAGRPR